MNYCEVCGVLIANAPPGVPTSICEKCFAQRKVIVAPDSGSDDARTDAPDRVQFACPACKSLLQLPPVLKRTKIKCPQCRGDFAMYPDGRIEPASTAGKVGKTPSTGRLEQEKLLGDLKPLRELDDLLARVPEKKGEALPTALADSGGVPFDSNSASAQPEIELDMLPQGVGPGEAAQQNTQDYVLLPDSSPAIDALPESRELDPVKDEAKPAKIKTARRTKDRVYEQRKEKEVRAQRAVEAQKHTLALIERNRKRTLATLKLVAVLVTPLLVGGLFLISTTQEGGFAVRGGLGHMLGDIGETARRGVEGVLSLIGSH